MREGFLDSFTILILVLSVQLILCPNIWIDLRHSNGIAFWMLRWFKKLTFKLYASLNSCNDKKVPSSFMRSFM